MNINQQTVVNTTYLHTNLKLGDIRGVTRVREGTPEELTFKLR